MINSDINKRKYQASKKRRYKHREKLNFNSENINFKLTLILSIVIIQ